MSAFAQTAAAEPIRMGERMDQQLPVTDPAKDLAYGFGCDLKELDVTKR